MILVLVLFIASLISLILSLLSIFNLTGVHYIPFVMLSIVTLLFGIIAFYKKTSKFPKNDLSEYDKFDWKKFVTNVDGNNIIIFEKKDGIWVCDNGERAVKLDLSGYLFQRAYLVSYVIRNMRYPLISDKKPLKFLFANSFAIKNRNIEIKLVTIDGTNRKEKTIVKNGVSRYGFLPRQITLSVFHLHLYSNYSYQRIRRFKTYMDENRYKNFYKK